MKMLNVSTSSFHKAKTKAIQSIDTAWKTSVMDKAPVSAARSKSSWDCLNSQFLREINCQ